MSDNEEFRLLVTPNGRTIVVKTVPGEDPSIIKAEFDARHLTALVSRDNRFYVVTHDQIEPCRTFGMYDEICRLLKKYGDWRQFGPVFYNRNKAL